MKKILFIIITIFSINVYATNRSTIVMDMNSKRILYKENINDSKLIASTTKIMTFVVAYEYANEFLDVLVEADDEILKMYGTSIYLSYKESMTLRDLLYGLMMRSGNDAAVVIAKFVAGSEEEFVKLMNKKAKKIGMNNTTFNNSHGLDEETKNYSTAYDMALLSIYASNIPFYREVTTTKYYKTTTSIKAYSWTNRNKFLFMYPNFTSGKTGYTPSAGKTFVSTSKYNDLELTIVSLNDANIYENHRLLYEEYFKLYKNYLIVSKNDFNYKYNNLYIIKDIYYPLKESELEKLDIKLINNNELVIYLDNKEIIKEQVYQKEIVKEEKLSFWDKIKKFFKIK